VAPFIAQRIWCRPSFIVQPVASESCHFTFYDARLDEAEQSGLYLNYRSQEYQQMRNAAEPWYTARFNDSVRSAEYYELRRPKPAEIVGVAYERQNDS
jgi:hypothetical protein